MKQSESTLTKFYCRASKADRDGFAPIEAAITVHGKRRTITLGRKERADEWQKKLKQADRDLADYLNAVRDRLNRAQTELMSSGIEITTDSLINAFRNKKTGAYTVDVMFNEYRAYLDERMAVNLSKSAAMKYMFTMDEFRNYMGGDTLVDSIVSSDIEGFKTLTESRYLVSTASRRMTNLKAIFKWAFNDGKTKTFPFNNVKIVRPNPTIDFLFPEEMEKLKSKAIDNERLNHIRDLFLFQCGSGLAFADLYRLEQGDVKYDGFTDAWYIHKNRVKTGKEYHAVLLPDAIEIWKRYNGVLPVICNQHYNAYLKELADICGIEKNLTTHMGRRTYATTLLNEDVPLNIIAKALGHVSIRTTEQHYAKTLGTTVAKEIMKLVKRLVGTPDDTTDKEEWRPVPGYDGYEASSLGRVRKPDRNGVVTICNESVYNGYKRVKANTKGDNIGVHRLVALAFLPNPDNKPEVDHIDGVPENNRVGNLQWASHKENCSNPITVKRNSEAQLSSLHKGGKLIGDIL